VVGGKGGGRGQVGQGGGIDPARVDEAFTSLQDYVRQHLKENT
jgi:alanyl-tRNA synthetase